MAAKVAACGTEPEFSLEAEYHPNQNAVQFRIQAYRVILAMFTQMYIPNVLCPGKCGSIAGSGPMDVFMGAVRRWRVGVGIQMNESMH